MPLKLMYITNDVALAEIAESNGVDRIFVDMEYIGKDKRQGGMDTVQCRHTTEDIKKVRRVVKNELLVRCNPIHNKTNEYCGSKEEIDEICNAGADIVMLPYFKTVAEVEEFISLVGGKAKTMLLVETAEAVEAIDDILNIPGIDEVFIGLNDLSLSYGKSFMFELLAEDVIEDLCGKFKQKRIDYGFGGIAAIGKGTLPAEFIIGEHYRLGSGCVILSRSFCNVSNIKGYAEAEKIFKTGIREIRDYEMFCSVQDKTFFAKNRKNLCDKIKEIVGEQN